MASGSRDISAVQATSWWTHPVHNHKTLAQCSHCTVTLVVLAAMDLDSGLIRLDRLEATLLHGTSAIMNHAGSSKQKPVELWNHDLSRKAIGKQYSYLCRMMAFVTMTMTRLVGLHLAGHGDHRKTM